MGLLWGTIGVLILIVWAITIFDIFRRHLGGKQTTLWLVLVIILPFIGALIYWIVRKPSTDEVEHYAEVEHEFRGTDPRGRQAPPPPP